MHARVLCGLEMHFCPGRSHLSPPEREFQQGKRRDVLLPDKKPVLVHLQIFPGMACHEEPVLDRIHRIANFAGGNVQGTSAGVVLQRDCGRDKGIGGIFQGTAEEHGVAEGEKKRIRSVEETQVCTVLMR
jgi:hypothetical protein